MNANIVAYVLYIAVTQTHITYRVEENDAEEEVVEAAVLSTKRHHDDGSSSLDPPHAFLMLMLQAYVVVGGVAYLDLNSGFVLFLAVNVLANLVLMCSCSDSNCNSSKK